MFVAVSKLQPPTSVSALLFAALRNAGRKRKSFHETPNEGYDPATISAD
jgi:hypothetical protein